MCCVRSLLAWCACLWLLAFPLVAEQPEERWYLISETELRSIEEYRTQSEREKADWLLQAQGLKLRAENSEARSARLEMDSGLLNSQLSQAREQNRKLEISFAELDAERLTQLSLKDGEIADLKQEVAAERLAKTKYKGSSATRMAIIIALAGSIAAYLIIKLVLWIKGGAAASLMKKIVGITNDGC